MSRRFRTRWRRLARRCARPSAPATSCAMSRRVLELAPASWRQPDASLVWTLAIAVGVSLGVRNRNRDLTCLRTGRPPMSRILRQLRSHVVVAGKDNAATSSARPTRWRADDLVASFLRRNLCETKMPPIASKYLFVDVRRARRRRRDRWCCALGLRGSASSGPKGILP
jgi:hypothetical protein